jgi:hypothetical protein
VKSFQTVLQKLQKLDGFKDNEDYFATRNDLAFIVSDVQFGNSLLKNQPLNQQKFAKITQSDFCSPIVDANG